MLVDTDPGIDDALALLLAWGTPGLDVAWITTVAGNVPVATATANVFRLLGLRGPGRVPRVVEGAATPLARPLRTATRYHGEDGLGDLPDWPAPAARAEPGDAARVIVQAARAGDTLLVALGPLTNLARAVALDRAALARLPRVVAMGGAVDVPGNVTPTAEFNMHVDPDAAAAVVDAGLALDLVPLDATRQAVVERGALETALARAPAPLAARVAAFTERGFRGDMARGSRGMVLHDPLALAVAVDPSLVTWERVRLTIGPDGETRRSPGAPNCRIARDVDTARFLAVFLERLCRTS